MFEVSDVASIREVRVDDISSSRAAVVGGWTQFCVPSRRRI